jgi:ribosomal protein S18
MRPSTAGFTGTLTAGAMDQFLAARQPWNEYLRIATKQDAEPFPTTLNSPPMYRDRKRGFEGWLMKEAVQLHYRRFPDERVIANLNRWRKGDTVDDISLQQFRMAQPFVLDLPDELGFKTPTPEEYLRLNYKNPAVISKYLTRTGHFYNQMVRPMNPRGLKLLRTAVADARGLGLYPFVGNPFWHRTQRDRPKPYEGEYDPARASVKKTIEHFAYNWLQTLRIRQAMKRTKKGRTSAGAAQKETHGGRSHGRMSQVYDNQRSGFSPKTSTVPGLMSLSGLRQNPLLYSKSSKKRMGFPNPLGTTKRL